MTADTSDTAVPTAGSEGPSVAERAAARGRRAAHTLWRLIVTTVGSCMRYRVTGLAAEGAFFAVLSVAPLIFALAGAVGYVSERFSESQLESIQRSIVDLSSTAATRPTS